MMEGVNQISHPLVRHKLTTLRKKETTTMEFRAVTAEIGLLLAYEATRDLPLRDIAIETPLESATAQELHGRKTCIISILRAGNGLLDGVLKSDDGTWWQFLHMEPNSIPFDKDVVNGGDGVRVTKGQRLGKISNVYYDQYGNRVATTIHLHLDMKESYAPTNGDEPFIDRVNPYMTLVAAYERKLRGE